MPPLILIQKSWSSRGKFDPPKVILFSWQAFSRVKGSPSSAPTGSTSRVISAWDWKWTTQTQNQVDFVLLDLFSLTCCVPMFTSVQFSSDQSPFGPTDPPHPLNILGEHVSRWEWSHLEAVCDDVNLNGPLKSPLSCLLGVWAVTGSPC